MAASSPDHQRRHEGPLVAGRPWTDARSEARTALRCPPPQVRAGEHVGCTAHRQHRRPGRLRPTGRAVPRRAAWLPAARPATTRHPRRGPAPARRRPLPGRSTRSTRARKRTRSPKRPATARGSERTVRSTETCARSAASRATGSRLTASARSRPTAATATRTTNAAAQGPRVHVPLPDACRTTAVSAASASDRPGHGEPPRAVRRRDQGGDQPTAPRAAPSRSIRRSGPGGTRPSSDPTAGLRASPAVPAGPAWPRRCRRPRAARRPR